MTNHTECRKKVVFLFIIVLSWSTVVTQSHFKPCPDQWTHYGASCYLLTSREASLQEATEACRQHQAHLVFIEGPKELNFVTGFLDEDSSPVWLGARYDRRRQKWVWSGDSDDNCTDVQFSQWSYGASAPDGDQYCSAVRKDGWWDFVTCSGTLPFLCENSRPCEAGWYGGDCEYQCHCLSSDPCNKEDGVCPRGCSPGWSGASCTIANPLPDASFHCLRTSGGDLRADLMVDVRGRRYSVIQAVSQEGEPLSSCTLQGIRQQAYQISIPLLLPGAFAEDDDDNGTDSSGNNVTDMELTSEASALSSSPLVTTGESENLQSSIVQSTHASTVAGSVDTTSSASTVGSAAPEVTTVDGGEDGSDESVSSAAAVGGDDDDNSTVAVTASYGDEATEGSKRDVNSGNRMVVKSQPGEACVANRSENGSVTWLIEFKEFPEVLTGNDVTVEVTCDLNEADSLEFVDAVADNSKKGVPMEAFRMPVTMSVYLTDHLTDQVADHFHLGQQLRLHVDVQGLSEHECAFPHSCLVKPRGAQGQKVQLLDEHGCGTPTSPVGQLRAKRTKGQFTSEAFPAFSLGSSAVELECQIHVEPTADVRQCQTSCRRA